MFNQGEMPTLYGPPVKKRIRELAETGLIATEITRRLNEGTAGLEEPVPVNYRRVREIVADWEAEHGPPKDPNAAEEAIDTAERLFIRALRLMQREVAFLEQKRPGRISAEQSRTLRTHIDTVHAIHQRMKGDKRQRNKKGPQSKQQRGTESALERLAAQMGEATTGPSNPDPIPKSTSEDDGVVRALGQKAQREQLSHEGRGGLLKPEAAVISPSVVPDSVPDAAAQDPHHPDASSVAEG